MPVGPCPFGARRSLLVRVARFGAWTAAAALLACGPSGPGTTPPLELPTGAPQATLLFVGDVSGHGIVVFESDPDPFAGAGALLPPADVFVPNLEGVLSPPPHAPGDCAPVPGNHLLDAPPRLADFLARAPITLATLANNHAMDCGAAGLALTTAALDAHAIHRVGAGSDREEACAGTMLRVGAVDVFVLAYLDYPAPELWTVAAGSSTAGVATWKGCAGPTAIAAAASTGAYVVVCLHLHATSVTASAIVTDALDAGADLVVVHGSHVPAGVLVRDGGVALLGLGNFLFDPTIAVSEESRDVVTASVALHDDAVVVRLAAGRLDALGRPVPATPDEADGILSRVVAGSGGDAPLHVQGGAAVLVAPRRRP